MIELLLFGGIALLIISAVLAPVESLGWYAGWFGDNAIQDKPQTPSQPDRAVNDKVNSYLVYLSGIGAISPDSIPDEELPFLTMLEERLPKVALVHDVFPYSVQNSGLTGQRLFTGLWRRIEARRFKNPNDLFALIVNIRNMLQVAVSADSRYGPIYNLGTAREIFNGLMRNGYRRGLGTPVTLIGWSGGAQIAIGAAYYLASMVDGPINVISLGGVMASDPGINKIEHIYHLYGDKDPLHGLGHKLYPGRWAISPQSSWNRALRAGRITLIPLGPFGHNGKGNYFDMGSILPGGRPYGVKTVDTICEILEKLSP